MKNFILPVLFIVCFSSGLKAQEKQTIDIADFKKHLNKIETLCDTVYSFKIVSDTLTLVNMGGNYPNQKFTVAIKGNKISLDWINLKKKHLCVTGVLELYKNTQQITIVEPYQVVVSK